MATKKMKLRNIPLRKDGGYITIVNGFILLGCVIGNFANGKLTLVYILIPFVILLFTIGILALKFGK